MIGGLALLPFALRQAQAAKYKLTFSSILRIASLGILNVCVSMLLLQLSIFYGKASLTAVIVSMNPLVVSLFAMLLIHEKLSKAQSISLGMGIFGLGLIVLGERDFASVAFINLPLGIGLAIGASLSFGLWTVLTKSAVAKYGNLFTNSISFLIGGLALSLLNLAIGKPLAFSFSLRNLLFISYLGFIITGVAYLLYFEGMKIISASRASAYFFLKPAIASLMAYAILKETLSGGQLAGICMVVLSLSLPNLLASKQLKKERARR